MNGVNPPVGIDKSVLKNGDIVFLYFGNQRQVTLSTAVATIGASFTATAQKYDPVNNAYVASTGFIIGVTQPNPNPNDWWNPIEIATSTADANGQAVFTINTAGIYNVGIKEYGNIYDSYFPLTTLTITAPVPSSGGSVILPTASGGGTATVISSPKVDLGKAIDFLIAKQGADGSYGSSLQTDWAAIALASTNPNGSAAQKTKSYLLADPDPLIGMNPVSDYARRAMALMSLNISPYDGTKTNYIKKIISLYDGQQFGDASLYNDDIFALMVLAKAGYTADDEIIQNAVNFIISKQQVEGSWAGTDLTAAAIQALTPLSSLTEVTSALEKARNFLADAQATNGGFGNTYATAWAMQAIAALGENSSDWQKNGQTPESYLALSQGADGGLEKDNTYEANRIWATSYAIPAIQSKPWFNIMQNFSKQAEPALVEISVNEINIAADEIATSTLEKLDIATSSPEVLITASSTESSLQIKTVEEKIEPKTVDVFPEPVKPRVLSAKIVSPEPINMGNIKIEKKPNQEITQRETAPADAAIQASVQDNGGMAWATAKEKINTMAKKVLYFVTDGVAAAAALILKLLEFVL
ncbi:MAG: hypothetical protein COX91_00045 [Candidatus Nealsonbacteria bacterium CG_4_10_14_0_2_um_filter_39_15]|uniref:Squalene cyclase C-terminal domain-containing protein n=1 Tax=Candidatus Nealsonbacteria bacterium CG_4_10_14_0_2_um_filter_39_15 TaxID=1974681 RepID=A0A2M7UWY9_9BACT|nr:MAG: hypothetical protein COX91_00045 [Candidatus Nealsonbacteria bacterium CG_4_10_14_0_2_um_filter_39_15]